MNQSNLSLKALLLTTSLIFTGSGFAEETTMEKANTQTNKASDAISETYRDAQDKACPMVNGKADCAAKKMKHKAKNLSNKAKTKVKEIKDKVD